MQTQRAPHLFTFLSVTAPHSADRSLVSLEWFSGMQAGGADTPKLALCFKNGRCQIMRDFTDDNPVLIDTGMVANCLKRLLLFDS